jgi:hypothetical protein
MLRPLEDAGDHDRGDLLVTWQASSYAEGETPRYPRTWAAVISKSRQFPIPLAA